MWINKLTEALCRTQVCQCKFCYNHVCPLKTSINRGSNNTAPIKTWGKYLPYTSIQHISIQTKCVLRTKKIIWQQDSMRIINGRIMYSNACVKINASFSTGHKKTKLDFITMMVIPKTHWTSLLIRWEIKTTSDTESHFTMKLDGKSLMEAFRSNYPVLLINTDFSAQMWNRAAQLIEF